MTVITTKLEAAMWPHLIFNEAAVARLAEVQEFFVGLEKQRPDLAEEIINEFHARMEYLNNYGGVVSSTNRARRFRLTLGKDWADKSFSITWEGRDAEGKYRYTCSGGLIWHGGPGDPLTVSVTPQFWGIHS
jgi:hypothetical protein